MTDQNYCHLFTAGGLFGHAYGTHVQLIQDPLALTHLARLCHPDCVQPEINRRTDWLYRNLVREVINREFPRRMVRSETRMSAHSALGFYEGQIIDPETQVTTVDIARAGILPSMTCFQELCDVLNPKSVRQDHHMTNRTLNAEGHVTGAATSGRKIAGPTNGRILLFPDPMGATGGSLTEAIRFYLDQPDGAPSLIITLDLIITPEFIRRLTDEFKGTVKIYAYRLDRGLSPSDVLKLPFGERWKEERGLDDRQYIVPGAGGMGEVMNNALE
ncbi:MAG: hypothetical protein A2537_01090 [Candidatus Magasanikbacteria bacterium RIFOXYD2_FULL_36_9]|uniref:Phosphoribosyltransferase domain-containing protein n=1 Tax=Candidatus Magasanikbacteria bacterium RIFOXYD2_FULL_36_9 TaxID=1798707 RepID=A0A1F6P1I3_9BACT|nr:MAG: hypothetical protein A2537_01090 [Candidatus Magasanikbacteria bacterium RIFOXYD2_FULL_36_9]